MLIDFIHWNASPEIFMIGGFGLRWYGLFFGLAFVIGYSVLKNMFLFEHKSENDLDMLAVFIVFGSLIGARLGHCLFYEPGYYLYHPLDIIKPWTGELGKNPTIGYQGLASHGGGLGILAAIAIFAKIKSYNYVWLMDRLAIAVVLGGIFIRLGNLMNSEIVGMPTQVPWAFIFVKLRENTPRHPAQLYEAICYFGLFIILYAYYLKNKANLIPGKLTGYFFVSVFVVRFLIEFLKENQVSFENHMAIDMGQILSIPFILFGIYMIYKPFAKKNSEGKIEGVPQEN